MNKMKNKTKEEEIVYRETSITIGDINIQGFDGLDSIKKAILELLGSSQVKEYLDVMKRKQKEKEASYCE